MVSELAEKFRAFFWNAEVYYRVRFEVLTAVTLKITVSGM
jgi:hypothetical protein